MTELVILFNQLGILLNQIMVEIHETFNIGIAGKFYHEFFDGIKELFLHILTHL